VSLLVTDPARDTEPTAAALNVRDLRVTYHTAAGPVRAVNGVSFFLRRGERFGLVGESGSGKTTTALSLMRLLQESADIEGGEVLLDGVDLLRLSEEEMRMARFADIALIPQGAMNSLNPMMKVGEQLRDTIRAHRKGSNSRLNVEVRIREVLASVELHTGVIGSYPHELSGGMKQRVCIAMAIALNPSLIIADEPTSALDVVVQRVVAQTLMDVKKRLNVSMILIGHDMGLQAQLVDRIAVMYAGNIAEITPAQAAFDAPLHPYTQLLIASIPSIKERKALHVTEGLTHDLRRPPPGCVFHLRCEHVADQCRAVVPLMREMRPGQHVACHRCELWM
jgi:peptide/nickel transport system ATP-binding protein